MECLRLDLPLLFETIHNILVAPPYLVRETLLIVSLSIVHSNNNFYAPSLYSTFDQVSTSTPATHQEQPFVSSCRMVEELPRTA
jgi:hypothetical protein